MRGEVPYRATASTRLSKAVPYSVVMLYGKTDVTLWRNGGSVNDGRIKGVFSPNKAFIYELAQLAPYELTHVRASHGDCAAGWAQAARKV